MKEGGSLFGGTCEHCEDRAPSGPRQDSVRTLSGLCQDYVRTLSGLCQDCQDSCGRSTNQVDRGHERPVDAWRGGWACLRESGRRLRFERWLATNFFDQPTSPLTGGGLEHSILVPNHMLRRQIRDWEGARKAV